MARGHRLAAVALMGAAVLAAGCGAKNIRDVLADPARYRGQTITVRGTVAESVSIVGRGIYRIADGEHGLWVVTTTGAPRDGARVHVTGRLEDGYDLGPFARLLKLPESMQTGVVMVASSYQVRD